MQKFLLCTLVWNGIPAKCMRLYKSQVLRFIKKLFKRFWNVHNNNFKYEPQYHLDLDYSYQAKCPRCVREYFYQEIGIRDAQLSKNTLRHIIMLYMVHVNIYITFPCDSLCCVKLNTQPSPISPPSTRKIRSVSLISHILYFDFFLRSYVIRNTCQVQATELLINFLH